MSFRRLTAGGHRLPSVNWSVVFQVTAVDRHPRGAHIAGVQVDSAGCVLAFAGEIDATSTFGRYGRWVRSRCSCSVATSCCVTRSRSPMSVCPAGRPTASTSVADNFSSTMAATSVSSSSHAMISCDQCAMLLGMRDVLLCRMQPS